MTDVTKHSPLPWVKVECTGILLADGGLGKAIANIFGHADADFILRAVNSQYQLVELVERFLLLATHPLPGAGAMVDTIDKADKLLKTLALAEGEKQ